MSSAAPWRAPRARGCQFVLVSPLRDDLPEEAGAEWISSIPGTDTALMLALAHTLVVEGLHDRDFLDRYTVGWPVFERYLLGETDGQPKDAAWAAAITGVAADDHRGARARLHGRRALIVVSHSLQRAEHGEQPVWMGAVLAAALGQIGLPGGGYGYALGAIAYYGRRYNAVPTPTLPQGRNGVSDFIPVARIADMLLNPGGTYRYNGQTPHLSRHPPGLLGRRQSVPSSSGSQPAAPGLCASRHAGGARTRLDRDGAARRYRAALRP